MVQGTGPASDNGARGRCTAAREGAGRGPGQSAITAHGDGARVHGKVQGTGAERVHGDGVRVHGKVQEGTGQSAITVHGRAPEGEGAGDRGGERERCTGTLHGCTGRCRGPSAITVHGDGARIDKVEGNGGRAR